jgi:hypothetical protein
MAAPRLGYLDYVKAAFHRRVPVPGMGVMPVNWMGLAAFAVLGLLNPGFWLLGAAAELTFLLGVSSNPRFQKLIDAERLADARTGWEDRVHGEVERLSEESGARYRRLLAECRRILGISETLDAEEIGGVRGLRSGSLNQLLWIFLRLLRSRELIADNLAGVERKEIEREIQSLESRLGGIDHDRDAALARSLQGTFEILGRRLANLDRAAASLQVIDAEMGRIEQHVELIREESAVSGKAEALSSRLDAVTNAMSETTRWMADNAELFGDLGDDPTAVSGDLPHLPERASEGES